MGKSFFLFVSVIGLFFSACKAQTVPAVPTSSSPEETPQPSSTSTPGSFIIGGEFTLTNTSTPGMEVGVETMAMVLKYRLSITGPWEKVLTSCSFDPPAPLVLKEQVVVQYECTYMKQLPPDAEMHTTAEVRIFGNDQVFQLDVNSP